MTLLLYLQSFNFMNDFSEKDIASIQDFIQLPFLNKCSRLLNQKTQLSIAGSDKMEDNQNAQSSGIQILQNDCYQKTTINQDNSYKNTTQTENTSEVENKNQLRKLFDHSIYFQGEIYRKQKSILSSWEKRYIVLTNSKLFFFQNDKKIHLLGCVYIKYLPISLLENQKTFELSFNDDGQTISLKGINEIQNSLWITKIQNVIKFCQNEKKIVIRKFNRTTYEQKDFVLQQQFIQNAETGDLLLVSSDNSASYLQKFLTHSQFNHVAMIFKYQNQLKIFEANEQDGVFIYDWKQYLQMFKDHKRFAWRKLIHDKKSDFEQKFKQLAKKYMGRSYSMASSKFLRRTSTDDNENDEERQFFCSQIVAKIYKSIRILDQQVSSVRYWPINFTSRGELNLMDGAYLTAQKNILLSKHLKL